MKQIFLLMLVAANCYAEPFAYEKPVVCDTAIEIFSMIQKEYDEKVTFSGNPEGAGETGSVIVVTENKETGTWSIIQFNSKFACVLAVGKHEKT